MLCPMQSSKEYKHIPNNIRLRIESYKKNFFPDNLERFKLYMQMKIRTKRIIWVLFFVCLLFFFIYWRDVILNEMKTIFQFKLDLLIDGQ